VNSAVVYRKNSKVLHAFGNGRFSCDIISILGIKWSDFITNAEVYNRSGLQSIQSIVRRRRLSLFGHVARMPDNVDYGAVLLSPGCIRFVQTGLSAKDALNCARHRPCGERTLRPARPRVRWRRRRRYTLLPATSFV